MTPHESSKIEDVHDAQPLVHDPTLFITPNPSAPDNATLPILRFEFPPQGELKPRSFEFTPTAFDSLDLQDWIFDTLHFSLLWSAPEYFVCLAFPTIQQREQFIAQCHARMLFRLNLRYELNESYLIHSREMPWGRTGMETFRVQRESTTIISPEGTDRGFVVAFRDSRNIPRLILQRQVKLTKRAGNWFFMIAEEGITGNALYIIECATTARAAELHSISKGRAFELLTDRTHVLGVTRFSEGAKIPNLTSHSEGRPDRVPWREVLNRFHKFINKRADKLKKR